MKVAFNIQGLWSLRPDQAKKAQGTLSYDPNDGLILTLGAAIQTGEIGFGDFISVPNEVDIILGETPNGALITLHKCIAIDQHYSAQTLTHRSVWRINYAFLNIQKTDANDLVFTKCTAQISNLFEWLNQSGLEVRKQPSRQMPLIIQFDKPAPIDFSIDDQVSGLLQFNYSYNCSSSYSSTIDFNHGVELIIKTQDTQRVHYEELINYLKKFIHWLTISTGQPCRIEKLTFFNPDHYHDRLRTKREEIPVNTYLRITDAPFMQLYNPGEFNFTYTDLKLWMPTLLIKWFGLYPELSVIIQILAENTARNSSFSEFHFKDIVQALESYHRKRKNNNQMDKGEFKTMMNEVLGQIQNDEYRKFIKDKLAFGNEPILAKRLAELIDEPDIKALRSIFGDRKEFVKVVKNNRNYLTHYDDSLKKKALSAADLYWLSEKVLVLLFVTVLSEIIPESDFWEDWLQKSQRWSHFIRE